MNYYENVAFLVTFIMYSISMLLYLWYFVNRKSIIGKIASLTAITGLAANTVALVIRSIIAGHLPVSNGYEFLLAFVWGIVAIFLWVERRYRFGILGTFVMPLAWVILAYIAVLIPSDQKMVVPLMAALKK